MPRSDAWRFVSRGWPIAPDAWVEDVDVFDRIEYLQWEDWWFGWDSWTIHGPAMTLYDYLRFRKLGGKEWLIERITRIATSRQLQSVLTPFGFKVDSATLPQSSPTQPNDSATPTSNAETDLGNTLQNKSTQKPLLLQPLEESSDE